MLNSLKQKAEAEFETSLPMGREDFRKLFDHLDIQLGDNACDDTPRFTKTFLENIGAANVEQILKWLADKGGYCDCEILANVEEQFE